MTEHMITFRPFYWLYSFMAYCIDLVVLLGRIKQKINKATFICGNIGLLWKSLEIVTRDHAMPNIP